MQHKINRINRPTYVEPCKECVKAQIISGVCILLHIIYISFLTMVDKKAGGFGPEGFVDKWIFWIQWYSLPYYFCENM